MLARMLALLLRVTILSLFHPHSALVWADGAAQPVEVRAGQAYGNRGFTIEVGPLRRSYRGRLIASDGGSELRLINEVELEDYVASVVGAEMAQGPAAARQALAIAARSFAVRTHAAGHLCDTTHCQWYRGLEGADFESARRTRGQVLLLEDGEVAQAFHSQDCGGATGDSHPAGLPPGHGHGRGLCQRGALFQATKGASAHQIVARYFPGLRIGVR